MRVGYVVSALRGVSLPPLRSATYHALNGQPNLESTHDVEGGYDEDGGQSRTGSVGRKLWAPVYRRSTYYWISFLCNCFLVLFGYIGWKISSERDSSHETKNTARFIIASVYSLPSLAMTGLLLFWHYNRDTGALKTPPEIHVKLSLFSATNNGLAVLFMIIFTLIFDDPKSRFGTGDDMRNTLLPLIIILAAMSLFAVLTAAWITYAGPKPFHAHAPSLTLDVNGVTLPPMGSPWILPADAGSPVELVEHPPAKLPP